jgi:hypothetical protein
MLAALFGSGWRLWAERELLKYVNNPQPNSEHLPVGSLQYLDERGSAAQRCEPHKW